MSWSCYIIGQLVIIPTVSLTEDGLYLETEPVRTESLNNTEELVQKILGTVRQGYPYVPAPQPGALPRPVVLKYAKAKSWSTFERNAALWSISEEGGEFVIGPDARAEDRGWVRDPTRLERIPGTVPLESVVRRLVVLMQVQSS